MGFIIFVALSGELQILVLGFLPQRLQFEVINVHDPTITTIAVSDRCGTHLGSKTRHQLFYEKRLQLSRLSIHSRIIAILAQLPQYGPQLHGSVLVDDVSQTQKQCS